MPLFQKTAWFLLLVVFMVGNTAKAQDSTNTEGANRLQRYELVIGSGLAFSLVDYLGYNIFVT